jgi:(p)ppGpp synthase/HD superfamily hydrolase
MNKEILELENPVNNFLEFRKNNSLDINTKICENFFKGTISNKDLEEYFKVDLDILNIISFVLESFSKPKDPSKARRKDGSHIAVHSLILFKAARDYFKIDDKEVYKTLLVHDLIEDTQVSKEEIKNKLGEEEAKLAELMTQEKEIKNYENFNAEDKEKLSLLKFIQKLKSGGRVIAIAEIIDRIDDVSDLAYLTNKLKENLADKDKIKQALIKKFGKCKYTVDEVAKETKDETVINLKKFFYDLIYKQLDNLANNFNLKINLEEIESEYEKYKKLENYL